MIDINSSIKDYIQTLGWDEEDDIVVEIGGTIVSGIHQGENYNEKWATPYGVRKYNTFPRVIKDDTIIGGCTETVKYLREQNLV